MGTRRHDYGGRALCTSVRQPPRAEGAGTLPRPHGPSPQPPGDRGLRSGQEASATVTMDESPGPGRRLAIPWVRLAGGSRGVCGVVVDRLLCHAEGCRCRQGFSAPGVPRVAGWAPLETWSRIRWPGRNWWAVGHRSTRTCWGWGLADVSRISPSVMFTDLPFGSASHRRAKKSVCGRLELAISSAVTGPVISRAGGAARRRRPHPPPVARHPPGSLRHRAALHPVLGSNTRPPAGDHLRRRRHRPGAAARSPALQRHHGAALAVPVRETTRPDVRRPHPAPQRRPGPRAHRAADDC